MTSNLIYLQDRSWKAAKVMMGKVDDFLSQLLHYDKENIPEMCQKVMYI